MDLVLGILYDQIHESFTLSTTWENFTHGGKFSSQDDWAKGRTAYTEPDEEHSLWALQLKLRDPYISRRRWVYNIGLRRMAAGSAMLHYAKCCYDHMAGSINEPKPITLSRDSLLDPIFYNNYIQCMCGKEVLPTAPIELCHTSMPNFLDILKDELRTIPIILITCTWLLSPEVIQDFLLGNAVIYWCDDSSVVMHLNSILPQNLYTPWNSVHVFVPICSDKVYHPVYTYEDIQRMGSNAFHDGLQQAYCRSLRAEDQRNFINVNEVYRCRDRVYINTLLARYQKSSGEISELNKLIDTLKAENQSLNEQMQVINTQKTNMEITEYESLLSDTMAELDMLKNGISALSVRLYSSMGIGFQPDETEQVPLLQELQHAIYASLACANSRR